jgi:hypothetical protein
MAYTCYSLLLQKLYVLPQRLVPGRGKTRLLLGQEHRIITSNYIYQGSGALYSKIQAKLHFPLRTLVPISSYQEQQMPCVCQNVSIKPQLLVCIF